MMRKRLGPPMLFRVLTVLSASVLFAVTLFFVYSFCEYRRYRLDLFEEKQQINESFLVEKIKLVNRGLVIGDSVIDNSIKGALIAFRDMYSATFDVSSDLLAIKKAIIPQLAKPIKDVVLNSINKEGVVTLSTNTLDLGLDFKKWPPFYRQLLLILENKYPVVDPWSRNLNYPGMVLKYGYIPAKDGSCILSIGVKGTKDSNVAGKFFSYDEVLRQAEDQGDDLKLAFIINRNMRFSWVDDKTLTSMVEDWGIDLEFIRDQAFCAFEEKKSTSMKLSVDFEGRWTYVDFEDHLSASGENLNVVLFSLFSLKSMNTDISSRLMEDILGFFMTVMGAALVALSLYRYLSTQLSLILEDLERISSGDLDHRIRGVRSLELRRLEKSVNRMVRRLRRQREKDRHASKRLSLELDLKKQMEGKLKLANQSLFKQATVDDLTGLFNRRSLMSSLEREIARCREEGASLGLMVIDLDKFKEVNDMLGHVFGDRVLAKTATFLREVCRGCLVGRYGGDEFMCILPGDVCGRMVDIGRELLRRSEEAGLEGVKPSFSVGGTVFFENDTAESILHRADSLMYRAKKNRNTFCFDVDGKGSCMIP